MLIRGVETGRICRTVNADLQGNTVDDPAEEAVRFPRGSVGSSSEGLCGSAEVAVDDLLKGCVVQQRVLWMIH